MSSRSLVPASLLLACLGTGLSATASAGDDCEPTRRQFPRLDITAYEFRRGDTNCQSAQRIFTNCLDANGAVVRTVSGRCVPVEVDDRESTPPDEEN